MTADEPTTEKLVHGAQSGDAAAREASPDAAGGADR